MAGGAWWRRLRLCGKSASGKVAAKNGVDAKMNSCKIFNQKVKSKPSSAVTKPQQTIGQASYATLTHTHTDTQQLQSKQ